MTSPSLPPPIAPSPDWLPPPAVAVIGGSGFYDLPGLAEPREVSLITPFGSPSDALRVGRLGDRTVVFLARHGRGHTVLPHEVNARANIFALKMMGVTQVIAVTAVGSLREEIAPGDTVLPHQFIDRTIGRPRTFFGDGVVAHVAFAKPVCLTLSDQLAQAAAAEPGGKVHRGGTYLCIEGPQFSTRAEADLWRQWGGTVVGMTNLPEARLAREAELCYATLALPTDYDCWRDNTSEVTATDVFATLRTSVDRTKRIIARALATVDPSRPCACQTCLDQALVTPAAAISPASGARLELILRRRLLTSS